MPSLTLELVFSSLILAATSLSSRVVAWLPSRHRHHWLPWLQGLAVGLLLGDALLHVLPHALEQALDTERALAATSFGVVLLLIIESTLRSFATASDGALSAARTALTGDLIHHLVDGIILAGAFVAGPAAGYAALVAIALHEVPREMSNAAALVGMGYAPTRAFGLSVMTASAVPVAALSVHALSLSGQATATLSAFAAGTILYVALADILPGAWLREQARRPWVPAVGAVVGLVFMALLAHAEHHH